MTDLAGRPNPRLVLSQVEVEALRTLRTRLNKPAISDAASATLGRVFYQLIARADLAPAGDPVAIARLDATIGPTPAAAVAATRDAGMAELNLLLAVLHPRLTTNPAAWRALQSAGAPQAVISRRLQLAGREPNPSAHS
ncbi:hypothetical protein [Caulobacter sp. S45]|jgi:hypothetical protein|uniref:hypothetical protein n=1 Tax=Caulobacter sp. S45 TaxID=1641861 RepID=UPI00131D10D6|nr:hypothetical protein [Caulobacter sp. S45]